MADHYTAKGNDILIPIGSRQVVFATAGNKRDAKVIAHLLNVLSRQVEEERELRRMAMENCKE
jgi:hypothetical protein